MSAVPQAKAALTALWADALPGSQVINGSAAGVTTLTARVVEVGAQVKGNLDVTALDLSSYSERFTVECVISVSLPGTNAQVAEDAALDDFAAATVAVQADPTLGVDNLSASMSGAFALTSSATDQGRYAVVTFPVEVFAVV